MKSFACLALAWLLSLGFHADAAPDTASTVDYDLLKDVRVQPIGPKNWLGNLKWYADESDQHLSLVFRTNPCDQSQSEYVALTQIVGFDGKVAEFPSARHTFFRLSLPSSESIENCAYRPDAIEAQTSQSDLSFTMPLHRYGVVWQSRLRPGAKGGYLQIDSRDLLGSKLVTPSPLQVKTEPGQMIWTDGPYTLIFRFAGKLTAISPGTWRLEREDDKILKLAVSFHISEEKAAQEANALFNDTAKVEATSRVEWNDYLASCPIADFPEGYTSRDAVTHQDITYSDETLQKRQLWHWACLLVNTYDIEFNRMPVLVTPDKGTWFGCWSNDSPEATRALSYTNQHALARASLRNYIRYAFTPDGDLSWYTHGTGIRGLHNPKDVGGFSYGVPTIITAVAAYVKNTGDAGFLNADVGDGRTVWSIFQLYLKTVFDRRDIDHDGLVDWGNLWEGGSDDKVSPFFSKANLDGWMTAVENLPPADLKKFYAENLRPVTNLYEQSFFLSALQAMQTLAQFAHDPDTGVLARRHYEQIVQVLESRHWDKKTAFYYDWDVTGKCLVQHKNQDAFYLLQFLPEKDRAARLVEHLKNPQEFGLRYTPTLAADDPGFKATGYWCGGYWPREAVPISLGLAHAGYKAEAIDLLVKAICSGDGKVILENVNPITGHPSTPIVNMAYSSLLPLTLKQIQNP